MGWPNQMLETCTLGQGSIFLNPEHVPPEAAQIFILQIFFHSCPSPVYETRRGVQAVFLGIVTCGPHLRVRPSSFGEEVARERGSTPAMDDCTDDSVKGAKRLLALACQDPFRLLCFEILELIATAAP